MLKWNTNLSIRNDSSGWREHNWKWFKGGTATLTDGIRIHTSRTHTQQRAEENGLQQSVAEWLKSYVSKAGVTHTTERTKVRKQQHTHTGTYVQKSRQEGKWSIKSKQQPLCFKVISEWLIHTLSHTIGIPIYSPLSYQSERGVKVEGVRVGVGARIFHTIPIYTFQSYQSSRKKRGDSCNDPDVHKYSRWINELTRSLTRVPELRDKRGKCSG